MMRTHRISTTATLLMVAIVLAAPIVVNLVLAHPKAPAPDVTLQHIAAAAPATLTN